MRKIVSIIALAIFIAIALAFLWPSNQTHEGTSRVEAESRALQAALFQYKETFGVFPSGNAQTIFRALTGKNAKGTIFINWRSSAIGKNGEPLDPWKSPYKFYFSDDYPLIRSAGKNKSFDSANLHGSDDYFTD
jgi:hypothetical protein